MLYDPWDSGERMVAPGDQVRIEGRCWEIVHLTHDMTAKFDFLKAEPCVVEHDPDLIPRVETRGRKQAETAP